MGRGRPRYDDVLTPREWEVLDLLKRGLSNAEIADRLGVTRDTAKFHVSEIITKLGVENREQAASWGGRPRFKFGWAPTFGILERLAAAGAGAVVVVAALLILWREPDEPAALLPPGIYVSDAAGADPTLRVDLIDYFVSSFDWSTDGLAFEATGQSSNGLTLMSAFDAASGAVLGQSEAGAGQFVDERQWPSPDGETLAIFDEGSLEIRDRASGSRITSFDGLGNFPFDIAWSPDSNWIALIQGPYDPQKPSELRVVSRQPGRTGRSISPAVAPIDYNNGLNWMDWAPDSQRLAFVRDGRIWLLDLQSGKVQEHTRGAFPVLTEPRWSPDGRELAFRSASGGLYVATANDAGLKYVAPADAVSISPSGGHIASLSGGRLWMQQSDGAEPKVIEDFAETHVEFRTDSYPTGYCRTQFPPPRSPVWAPSGENLLLTGSGDPPPILLVDSDGSRETVAIATGYAPQWSPNGKYISYVRDCKVHIAPFNAKGVGEGIDIDGYSHQWRDDGSLLVHLWSAGPGTVAAGVGLYSPAGKLLRTFAGDAVLSPDGDLVAVTERVLDPTGARHFTTVITAAGSGQTLWTLDDVSSVKFSPNSEWVAFESGPCCEAKLWILDVATVGSSPKLVTTARAAQGMVWAPDSLKLALTHRLTEESGSVLAVFDVRSGNLRTVAPNAFEVQWFPDSERLLFQTGPK